jgi:hypothetical protein
MVKTETYMSTVNYKNLHYDFPTPPSPILKAMDLVWANPLLSEGKIRVYINKYYRDIEDKAIRDTEEGVGVLNCKGNICYVGGIMGTFIWCASQYQIEAKQLAKKFKRDSVVYINRPDEFARRLLAAAYRSGWQWSLDCGPVQYDKRSFRDRHPTEDGDDDSDFYLFQKDQTFSDEKEYRFALTNLSFLSVRETFLDLEMGSCADIMDILTV